MILYTSISTLDKIRTCSNTFVEWRARPLHYEGVAGSKGFEPLLPLWGKRAFQARTTNRIRLLPDGGQGIRTLITSDGKTV